MTAANAIVLYWYPSHTKPDQNRELLVHVPSIEGKYLGFYDDGVRLGRYLAEIDRFVINTSPSDLGVDWWCYRPTLPPAISKGLDE